MSSTPRNRLRERERERERRRRRDEVQREQLAATGRERTRNLMRALGKRTLAAAQALPQQPRAGDLQGLSKQIVEAIRTEAGDAARLHEVERMIGKVTRSLAAVGELVPGAANAVELNVERAPQQGVERAQPGRPAEPRAAGATDAAAQGQAGAAAQGQSGAAAQGREGAPATDASAPDAPVQQASPLSMEPGEAASAAIEEAVRRIATAGARGGALAAAVVVGDSLRELLATVERAAEQEIRTDLDQAHGLRDAHGAHGAHDGENEGEDAARDGVEEEIADEAEDAAGDEAADAVDGERGEERSRARAGASAADVAIAGEASSLERAEGEAREAQPGLEAAPLDRARGRERPRWMSDGQLELRGTDGGVTLGPRGIGIEGRLGALSIGGGRGRAAIATAMGAIRFDGIGLHAQLAHEVAGASSSVLTLDRDTARLAVDGPFGSLQLGPDGVTGTVTGIGSLDRPGDASAIASVEIDGARAGSTAAGALGIRASDLEGRTAEAGAERRGSIGIRAADLGGADRDDKRGADEKGADKKPADEAKQPDEAKQADEAKPAGDAKDATAKQGADAKQGPEAKQAGDAKQGAESKQAGDTKHGGEPAPKHEGSEPAKRKPAADRDDVIRPAAQGRPAPGAAAPSVSGGIAPIAMPRPAATLATATRPPRDASPAPASAAVQAQPAPRAGAAPARTPVARPAPRSTSPAVIDAPPVPSPAIPQPAPGATIEQPSFQISAQGRTPPTPQLPSELTQPQAAAARPTAAPASPAAAAPQATSRPAARPAATSLPAPSPSPSAAAPARPPQAPSPTAHAPTAPPATRARELSPSRASQPAAPARTAETSASPDRTQKPTAARTGAAGPGPAAAPHPSNSKPVPAAPPTPAGATAAPRAPSAPARAPEIAPVRPADNGAQAPSPSGMVQRTVSLDGDRSSARSSIAAESETKREVPQQAAAAKQGQVAPLGPELKQQVPTVEAPARQASIAQGQQRATSTHQQGAQRAGQTSAQHQQQIAGQGQAAAQQRAQLASEPLPGIVGATAPAVIAGAAAAGARAEIAAAAAPARTGAQPGALGATLGAAGAAGATRIAARADAGPAETSSRAAVLTAARPLAPVETAGAAAAQAAAAGQYAAARTALEQPPEVPQIRLPGPSAPASSEADPTARAGAGPDAAGAGAPSRATAIANIEAGAAAQLQSQAPAQLAQGHAALAGEARGHLDRAEQDNARTITDAAAQADTGTQAAQQTLAATSSQAQATAQAEAQQHRATGQAQAQAAQATATASVAAAQATAQAEGESARGQRDAGVAAAQAGFESEQVQANAQYATDHAAAQQTFTAQNQQSQAQLASEQQTAQTQAQAANAQAKASTDAEIANERAQSDARRTQEQSRHEQQVAQANTQAQSDQQRIQSDMDQQVQQTDNRMRNDVSREETRGQQEVDRNLQQGEQGYQREIQQGEQQAEAERQRAEAAAAQKRAEADAQKDKGGGGGIFGKVVNWVKDRVNDLLDMAKSIIEAARAAVMRIMEAARAAAMRVLEAARAAAMAALNAAKSAIQGLISAAASAIRGLISAAANMIRSVIQALSSALQGLVRMLTTALNALVEAFQTFVNAALDGLIAAVSLINKDLGAKLQQATQGFRDRFNQACDGLQQTITEAGQRLEQGIQAAADRATAVVDAVEQQLNAAVTAIEQRAHQAVDQAFAVAEAAVNAAFDAVEAGVNAAFDAAEAVVDAAFDAASAAVEGYREAFNAACDAAIELADRALTALGDLAAAFVDLLPDSLIEGFIDFWNGPWRSMIIIGLATIAAVAITVATGGVGGPIAGMLLAGVIGGAITGTAYLGGELIARQGAIDLAENGNGIYVPNHGYVPIGPDGRPDLSGIPADQLEAVQAQLGPGGWAASNFQSNPDGTFQMGPGGTPVGKPSSEIANAAVLEGIQGFGEGFISAALAAGGGSVGAQLGSMVAKRFASQAAQRVVTAVVSGATEGVFDIASSGATTFWNTGFDALQAGKSPSEAFREAASAGLGAMKDPGAIAASLANIGVSSARVRGLDDLLDSRITNGLARQGADLAIDTVTETVAEAAGNFGYTLATTGSLEEARRAGAESFDPTKILFSAGMGAVGNAANSRAERYAEARSGGGGEGGSHTGDGRTGDGRTGDGDGGTGSEPAPPPAPDAPVNPRARPEPDPVAVVDRAQRSLDDAVTSQIPGARSTNTRRTQDGVEVRADTPDGRVDVVVTSRPRSDSTIVERSTDTAGRHVIDVLDTVGDADVPRIVEREVAVIQEQRQQTADIADAARRPTDDGGTAADVGAFRGDARSRDLPDLTTEGMRRQLAEGGDVIMPPGVTRSGDAFVLPDGGRVTIDVGLARDGAVASYESGPDGYRVTVSRRASDADVARAVAHELAEIHLRERGVPDGPDSLSPDAPLAGDAMLSAHDHGRLAEVRVLADQLGANPNDLRARHELQTLLDALGVRNGRTDADGRLDLIRPHLDPDTLATVERMRDPQPLRLQSTDVDTVSRILEADPRFTSDPDALAEVIKRAREGNEGALGELEAVQRWLAEGRTVEMLPEAQNTGRRNPDFRVDGQVVEVKTSTADIGDRGISRDLDSANNQIKKSGLGEQGGADVQLHGDAANAPLADIERQVRRQFNDGRSRSLDRVSVYRDGVLAGEWVRNPDGSVSRRFPAPDADARPAGAAPTGTGPEGAGGDRTGASSMVPNSTYRGDGASPNRAAVERSVSDAVPRLAGHFDPRGGPVRVNSDGSVDITVDGQTRNVRIEVASGDRMNSATDVANFDLSTDPATIRVAEGVDPHHVERALAHELAEMTSILRADASGADPSAARGGRDTDALTHDDLGRVAEVRVLLVDADPSRAGELHALLEHMGITGSDPVSVRRREQIERELGHPLPVTPEQQRAFDDARRVYQALANDPYQGPAAARAAWGARLAESGIEVSGRRRDPSRDDLSARDADPDAVRGGADVDHALPSSSVLPDAPTAERPYTPADRDAVAELRDRIERIRELDQNLDARDRQGDQERSKRTGDGDSDRRQQEVARVRELLAELQLGGTDPSYINRRLDELGQLFPDVDIRGGVTERVDNRRRAEEAHAQASEARERNARRQEELIARVESMDPPCVDRLVIGAGMAGLTNAATLPGSIGFPGMLMLGTADPIGQRNPGARWGQRTGSYDQHPLFGDAAPGSTRSVIEDPHEFMSIGELNDAMDIARDRLGVASYPGTAGAIEPRSSAEAGSWPDNGYAYRVAVAGPDGTTRYVYANSIDVTSGPGGTRMPNEGILSRDDLSTLRDRGDLIGGNDLLNERGAPSDDPEGRVFVLSFGPTGAWAASHSTNQLGADRVDWGGSTSTPEANQRQMDGTRAINRTRDAFNDNRIEPTLDPVLRMRPGDPRGVVVTFDGPDGAYDIHYNRVAVAMGFDARGPSGARGEQPSSGQLLDHLDMGLDPDGAPTLQSDDGAVRVLGAAATSGPGLDRADLAELRRRQAEEISQLTADSPTPDTAEFGGRTIAAANRSLAERMRAGDPASRGTTDGGGTASNLGDFRGDARQGPALTQDAVADTVRRNQAQIAPTGARFDGDAVVLSDGRRIRIEVGTPRDNSVASFEPSPDGYVVTISSRARDQDVIRALAHEVAEIQAGSRADVVVDATNDRPEVLTTHLVGRFAELRVLLDQIDRARRSPGDDRQLPQLERDLGQLVEGIGLSGAPDAEVRQRLLAQHDPALALRFAGERGAEARVAGAELSQGGTAAVPGSDFRGGRAPADPARAMTDAHTALAGIAARFPGRIQSIARAGDGYVVTRPDGSVFTLEIQAQPLGPSFPAYTRQRATEDGAALRSGAGVDPGAVRGHYLVEVSDTLESHQVERALDHELAEVLGRQQLADEGLPQGLDLLRAGPLAPGDQLSPRDQGRVAEINSVVRGDAPNRRQELQALIEHLGLRAGVDGAEQRRALIDPLLSPEARAELDPLRQAPSSLDAEVRAELEAVRDRASRDADPGDPMLPYHALPREARVRAPEPVEHAGQPHDVMGVSPDGELLLRDQRAIHEDQRIESLVGRGVTYDGEVWTVVDLDMATGPADGWVELVDPRDPSRTETLTGDDIPGIEFEGPDGEVRTLGAVRHGIARMQPAEARSAVVAVPLQPGQRFEARLRGRELEGPYAIEVGEGGALTAVGWNRAGDRDRIPIAPADIAPRYDSVHSADFGASFDVDAFAVREDQLRGQATGSPARGDGSPASPVRDPRLGALDGGSDPALAMSGGEHLMTFEDFIRQQAQPDPDATAPRTLTLFNISMSNQGDADRVLAAIVEFRSHNPDAEISLVVSKLGPSSFQDSPEFMDYLRTLAEHGINVDMFTGTDGPTRQVIHGKGIRIDGRVLFSTGAVMDTVPVNKADFSIELPPEAARSFQRYLDEAVLGDAPPERRQLLAEELARQGVLVNDPVAGLPYISRAHDALIRGASRELLISVSELRDPEMTRRIIERARDGVEVSLQIREIDPDSRALLEQAMQQYPNLRLADSSSWEPRPHFNAIVADDAAYVGTAYLWPTQRSMVHQGRSLENGVMLTGDAATSVRDQIGALESHARTGEPAEPADLDTTLGQSRGLRSDDGELDPQGRQDVTRALPATPIDLSDLDAARRDVAAFAAEALGLRAEDLEVDVLAGPLRSGRPSASAFLVRDRDGRALGVLKVSSFDGDFLPQLSAFERMSSADAASIGTSEGIGVARRSFSSEGITFMSPAQGDALNGLLDRIGEGDTGAIGPLTQGYADLGRTLANLHTLDPGPESVERVERLQTRVRDAFGRLAIDELTGYGLDPDASSLLEGLLGRFAADPGVPALGHGDAHPGNFFWSDGEGVTMIDYGGMHATMDSEGRGIGFAEHDVQRLIDTTRIFAARAEAPPEVAEAAIDAFLRSYREAGAARLSPATLELFKADSLLSGLHKRLTRFSHQLKTEEGREAMRAEVEALNAVLRGTAAPGAGPG